MWMDHMTFALQEIDALDGHLRELGLTRRPAEPLFDGTQRSLVLLQGAFVEFLAVSDRRATRQFTLGQALLRFLRGGEGIFRVVVGVQDLDQFMRTRRILGAQYWPPMAEQITGIAGAPVPFRVTQMDPTLPWVLEYQDGRPPVPPDGPRLAAVEVQSAHPTTTANQYRIALGCDVAEGEPPGGSPHMALENAVFHFTQGADAGFHGITIQGDAKLLTFRVQGGRVVGDVTRG